MDWPSIVLAGISGGLAAGIAVLLVGTSKERRLPFIVVLVVAMIGINHYSGRFVLPRIHDWQAERGILEIPLYREVAANDPEMYREIKSATLKGMKKGERKEIIASQISTIIATSLPRYIVRASDESVIAFAELMVKQTDYLSHVNPDACYQFLFPHEFGEPGLASRYLDKAYERQSIDVMTRIFHSAVKMPQDLPDAKRSEVLLDQVTKSLNKDFGADLLLIQKKPTDAEGRKKVCILTTALYNHALGLPQRDSSMLLRYIFLPSGN